MFRQTDRSIRAQRFSHVLPISIALLSLIILLPHSAEATPHANTHYAAPSRVSANTCFAQIASGATFSSTDAQAVRDAVLTATANSTVKIAGYCPGAILSGATTQVALITKTLSLAGGYTTTNWTTSNPIANPTILDAQNNGRVLYFNGVAGDVSNLTIQNGNSGDGGGISASNALTLTSVNVLSNTGLLDGGGAYAGGPATLNGGLFLNNFSDVHGGGLYAYSTVALTDTRFFSNTSGLGGGAFVSGTATLNGGVFQNNNSAGGYGGGLYAHHTLVLSATQFFSNTATNGGGASVDGAATLNGGLFQNNRARYGGGGLYAFSTFALTDTQFISNTAEYGGGFNSEVFGVGQTGRIINTLFARNVATSTLGAAVYLFTYGNNSVQILHTTIASPTLGSGSAIYIQTGTVGITDTIISNYSIGISRTAGSVYENYNLFFGNGLNKSGSFVAGSGANDVIGNPNFVNPANDNYHLKVGAAIGRGIDAGVSIDPDGNPRPGSHGFDIGAYQYTGALFRVYLPLALKDF